MGCTEMRNARWAIHSIICLHCAAAVVIGALAGLSRVWVEILCLVSVAFSVAALVLVVLAVLILVVEVGDWWCSRGSKVPGTYMYTDENGTRYED
jgi:hypothetical protein